ncbi:MAG: leucine-rich repeat domain-containing protein [Prevotellaceae bacterium]|nr:leucine-rich repeat domain-containing protein [Prevotellaceae bacterium]
MATVEYSTDGKVLIKARDVEGHFVVPEGVTEVGDCAFEHCHSLISIEIPDSLKGIGSDAFWGCSSLTSINIPNSVTKIGDNAFRNCDSLTDIEIPDSVTEIGWAAFRGCKMIKTPIIVNQMFVKLPETHEGRYSIPSGIQYICGCAFSDCKSLMNVDIPDSVTKIGGKCLL